MGGQTLGCVWSVMTNWRFREIGVFSQEVKATGIETLEAFHQCSLPPALWYFTAVLYWNTHTHTHTVSAVCVSKSQPLRSFCCGNFFCSVAMLHHFTQEWVDPNCISENAHVFTQWDCAVLHTLIHVDLPACVCVYASVRLCVCFCTSSRVWMSVCICVYVSAVFILLLYSAGQWSTNPLN